MHEFEPLQDNDTSLNKPDGSDLVPSSKMSLISRLITVGIIIHVVYLAVDQNTLFSLHPACMIIGVS